MNNQEIRVTGPVDMTEYSSRSIVLFDGRRHIPLPAGFHATQLSSPADTYRLQFTDPLPLTDFVETLHFYVGVKVSDIPVGLTFDKRSMQVRYVDGPPLAGQWIISGFRTGDS